MSLFQFVACLLVYHLKDRVFSFSMYNFHCRKAIHLSTATQCARTYVWCTVAKCATFNLAYNLARLGFSSSLIKSHVYIIVLSFHYYHCRVKLDREKPCTATCAMMLSCPNMGAGIVRSFKFLLLLLLLFFNITPMCGVFISACYQAMTVYMWLGEQVLISEEDERKMAQAGMHQNWQILSVKISTSYIARNPFKFMNVILIENVITIL